MLYLDSPLEIEGLTVYRDYNASNRFYYMPKSPRLTMEGSAPMFQLLLFRRDITDNPAFKAGDRPGGGFLTMTVDLGVPRATLDAAKGALGSRAGGAEVDLIAVPFDRGTVRVTALGVQNAENAQGTVFVEKVLGGGTPSLYEDNRTVFSVELTHEGAQLMRASLEDEGASQVAVVYDLQFRGLMPAYEGRIVISFRQSYSYLRTRFTLNTLVFKADIDAEMEKLRKEGHIRIEEADYLESDPAKRAERVKQLNELAKELATWAFFSPGLQPGRVLAADRGELKAADPTTAAEASTAGFTTPLDLALTGAGRTAPGASVIPGRSPRAAGIGGQDPVQGAENPQAAGAATTQPEAGGQRPLTAVERWNQAGRPQAAFLLKSLTQTEEQEITYDLRQVAVATRNVAPQGAIRLLAGSASLRGRIKSVDLNDPFFERVAGTVTTTADLEQAGVSSMVVKLRYGFRDDGSAPKDTHEVVLTKAGDRGDYAFFMDRRFSVDLEYQVVVNYKAGFAIGGTEAQSVSPWIRTTTRNLDVDPRLVGASFPVSLVVGAVDWTGVQSVQSRVVYEDAPSGVRGERTVVFSQAAPSAVVPIKPAPAGSRRFRVQTTYFRPGVQEVAEVQGEGETTVVVNPPAGRAVPVNVTAVDPLGRLRKATVELTYPGTGGQPEQTRLLELAADGASAAWTFVRPGDDAPAKYRFRVTLFGKDGTTSIGDWQETIERQLIVGDRFEGMLQVEVRFLGGAGGDLAATGYQGALMTLEYPDAPPGADGTDQRFVTGAPPPFSWRVPVAAGKPRTYRYSVRFIRNDGTEVVRSGESRDEVLMIFIPPPGA
jgi:hypothetical protein